MKLRLSNLIAAVSGKVSSTHDSDQEDEDDTSSSGHENSSSRQPSTQPGAQDKWNTAFNVRRVGKDKPASAKYPVATESLFEEGFLSKNRIVLGTKVSYELCILLLTFN